MPPVSRRPHVESEWHVQFRIFDQAKLKITSEDCMHQDSTPSVAIKLVNFANDLQISFDVDLNDVRMRLYSFASNPEGPWLLCLHGRST